MGVFNGGFPATYQQPYYPQYQQPVFKAPAQQVAQIPQNAQTGGGAIIWVQGEAGAKSYLVAPNNTVQLWDSESQTIYLKSADASGMPSMKILDYTIRGNAPAANPAGPVGASEQKPDYATREEVDALKGQIEGLRMRIGKIVKKEAADNE